MGSPDEELGKAFFLFFVLIGAGILIVGLVLYGVVSWLLG